MGTATHAGQFTPKNQRLDARAARRLGIFGRDAIKGAAGSVRERCFARAARSSGPGGGIDNRWDLPAGFQGRGGISVWAQGRETCVVS